MAVGAAVFPEMHPVKGLSLGIASAGIRYPGRQDVVIFAVDAGSSIAGVFTRNAFCAAPVHIAKAHLTQMDLASAGYCLINTGNANAGTGEQGFANANFTCQALADLAGVNPEQILPFSTGVIGEPLPVEKLINALPQALSSLDENVWGQAAKGIMTTDTRPKGSSRQFQIAGEQVTITGIAKGAGMIKPDMATMLGFIATDIAIPQAELNSLVKQAADKSFNRVTVDGDTSTNDSVILMATGKAKVQYSQLSEQHKRHFREQLFDVFVDLAQQIIKDGEGATKFVTVVVSGGEASEECLDVAFTVSESPLVKTALFASDPNWGRILAAVGRAGVNGLDVSKVSVWLNDVQIVEQGGRAATYTEESGQQAMAGDNMTITIDLNRGKFSEQVWTCDFSYDYVKINAEYRS